MALLKIKSSLFYFLLCSLLLFNLILPLSAMAGMTIAPMEPWATVFSGQEVSFHFKITARNTFTGRVGWRIATGGATQNRGEKRLHLNMGDSELLEIKFSTPLVKAGIFQEAEISVWAISSETSVPIIRAEKTLTIFPSEILVNRSQLLKDANIHLFDPDKRTVEVFQQAKIPFTFVRNVETISDIKQGILILGEGLSLKNYRGIAPMLIKLSASGTSVLCLAPQNGSLPLPDAVHVPKDNLQIKALLFRNNDIINELHPKLDPFIWVNNQSSIRSSFMLKGEGRQITADITDSQDGWPWLELQFEKNNSILVLCGFGIIENWHSSPTPRHLLARIISLKLLNKKEQ